MSQTLSLTRGEYNLFIAPPVAGVDFAGTPTPTVTYQWKKNGTAIAGQTGSLITGVWVEKTGGTVDLVDGDVISIDIILTNVVDVSTKTLSATIDSAIPAPVISPVSIRQLSGGTYQTVTNLANTDIGEQVIVASNTGGTVTTTPPVLPTYQWRRGFAPIAGATSQTYTLQAADADSIIDCVVTATNSGGSSTVTASVVVGTVADAGGWTALTPASDSRLVYVSNAGDDAAAALAKGRGYYLPGDPEIGEDPTNPAGPIVAYASVATAKTKMRTNPSIEDYPSAERFPDWMLFRRGDEFAGVGSLTGSTEIGGRSNEERRVYAAWGDQAQARPRLLGASIAMWGVRGGSNAIFASLDCPGANFTLFASASNVTIEDCRFTGAGASGNIQKGLLENILVRRSTISGNSNPYAHNQGIFAGGNGTVTIEECVFDRNGYKDNWEESRSWRAPVTSPQSAVVTKTTTPPDIYPYANQTLELWDVGTNTLQWTGVMPPTEADSVGADFGKRRKTPYEFASPTPLVASNPERMRVSSEKWYVGSEVHAQYVFEVLGAFTVTGAQQIRVLNTATGQVDVSELSIGVSPQPLRTYFDRNLYLSAYDSMTLRGNIISRDGGGSSVQMGRGGVVDRNLFIWNEMALTTGRGSSSTILDAIVKDNVILHDDHVLPPGGWGAGIQLMGVLDTTHVSDSNTVAHFHRGSSSGTTSISARGKNAASGVPQAKLSNAVITGNAVYHEYGAGGITIEPTTHNSAVINGTGVGVLGASVTNNSVSSAGPVSAQGDPSRPATYSYSGNRFFSPSPTPFRWSWHLNGDKDWRYAPYTDGTFSQWQAAGFDTDGSFTTDFAAFKSAAGWTAPERDIVSYMQSVDPTYVVNEDVYVDEESTVTQDVRQKVWEVLSDPAKAGNQVMTEAQAKLTARRYHAFITFIQRAKENRKGVWDTRWTAEAVNNYIREGFGKAPVTGPYNNNSLAARLAEYAS
jgi:hypothetical protein